MATRDLEGSGDPDAEQAPVTIAGNVLVITRPDAAVAEVSCAVDPQTSEPTGYFSASRPT